MQQRAIGTKDPASPPTQKTTIRSLLGSVRRFVMVGLKEELLRCCFFIAIKTTSAGRIICEGPLPRIHGRLPVIQVDRGGRVIFKGSASLRSVEDRIHIYVGEGATLVIGNEVALNGMGINALSRVEIGEHSWIAPRSYITDTSWHPTEEFSKHPPGPRPVVIGRNTWVCVGAIVLPGSKLGDHSILSPLSVLAGEIESKTLARGNPAKPVRLLNIVNDHWLRAGFKDPQPESTKNIEAPGDEV
jgi:acetyltransferase-like isoleucine patch superfamily enzyme